MSRSDVTRDARHRGRNRRYASRLLASTGNPVCPSATEVLMRCVVTGAAGFVGSHLCDFLLARGDEAVGIDAFTVYYDPQIKERNLRSAIEHDRFELRRQDLLDAPLEEIFEK